MYWPGRMTVLAERLLFQLKVTGLGEVWARLLPCCGAMVKQAWRGGPSGRAVQLPASRGRRSTQILLTAIYLSRSIVVVVEWKKKGGARSDERAKGRSFFIFGRGQVLTANCKRCLLSTRRWKRWRHRTLESGRSSRAATGRSEQPITPEGPTKKKPNPHILRNCWPLRLCAESRRLCWRCSSRRGIRLWHRICTNSTTSSGKTCGRGSYRFTQLLLCVSTANCFVLRLVSLLENSTRFACHLFVFICLLSPPMHTHTNISSYSSFFTPPPLSSGPDIEARDDCSQTWSDRKRRYAL